MITRTMVHINITILHLDCGFFSWFLATSTVFTHKQSLFGLWVVVSPPFMLCFALSVVSTSLWQWRALKYSFLPLLSPLAVFSQQVSTHSYLYFMLKYHILTILLVYFVEHHNFLLCLILPEHCLPAYLHECSKDLIKNKASCIFHLSHPSLVNLLQDHIPWNIVGVLSLIWEFIVFSCILHQSGYCSCQNAHFPNFRPEVERKLCKKPE